MENSASAPGQLHESCLRLHTVPTAITSCYSYVHCVWFTEPFNLAYLTLVVLACFASLSAL